jgi:hypothetical protein
MARLVDRLLSHIKTAAYAFVISAAFLSAANDASAQAYSEAFAMPFGAPPAGWITINYSSPPGTNRWFPGDPLVFPAHEGPANSYVAANQNATTGANTISNWLIAPRRTMRAGDVFKFWTRTASGSSKADRLQVRISTNGRCDLPGTLDPTSVGTFTTLLLDINPTYQTGASGYPQVWTELTITIPALESGNVGCFAFRYFIENGGPSGANSNYIGIDSFSYTPVSPTFIQIPSDFDGDHKSDIGIYRQAPADWWYQRSSDGQVGSFQFGSSTDVITPADFTGDGKTDIAVWRAADNKSYVLRSENFTYYSVNFGPSAPVGIPVPGDYDNDGIVDVAFYRPHDSLWVMLFSAGGSTGRNWGATGDKPLTGDFDGDGRSDVAVFRPSNGSWWVQRSSAGNLVVSFGSSTDVPVPGDYTGDGKTDIAFWRPSNGNWFILRSEDLSYYAFPFGISTDVPAPGDYDGDGKWDPTVFRPAGGVWYIGRSTGGAQVTVFGVQGDRPIANAFVR